MGTKMKIAGISLLIVIISWLLSNASYAITLTRLHGGDYYIGQTLTSVAATDNGKWFDTGGIHPFTIHIDGIGVATVQIRGSNKMTKPNDAVHGDLIGLDITADDIVSVVAPVRWIKTMVSSWTSGTINAYFYGYKP